MHIVRVTVLGIIAAAFMPLVFDASAQYACTMDAKMCPDGSYVGRQGPNCEFAACPGEVRGCTKELKICPDGTGVGRTGPNCAFEACPVEQEVNCAPYQCKDGTEVARCSEDGHVINYFAAPCHANGGEVGEQRGFSDVPESHANAEAILYVQSRGIVEGYADGTYRPDQAINRAEFVKILVESHHSNWPGPEECLQEKTYVFPDVHRSLWYASHVCFARNIFGVQGYPDGLFHGERDINFVEAAKIIVKASFDFEVGESQFDVWYRPYAEQLAEQHAIPMSIHSFDQKITRGEMAEIMYRLDLNISTDSITTKPSRTYEELSGINSDVCTADAEQNEIGSVYFPATDAYKHLARLGPIFTADDCGSARLIEVTGGANASYDLGSAIWLKREPSAGLLSVLQSIGYVCRVENNQCLKWELWESVQVKELLRLKPYAPDFEADDCRNCG